jgi:hypothetical protein
MAHNAGGSLRSGIADEKLAAVWEYREEPIALAEKHIAAHGWKLGKHASENAG